MSNGDAKIASCEFMDDDVGWFNATRYDVAFSVIRSQIKGSRVNADGFMQH